MFVEDNRKPQSPVPAYLEVKTVNRVAILPGFCERIYKHDRIKKHVDHISPATSPFHNPLSKMWLIENNIFFGIFP